MSNVPYIWSNWTGPSGLTYFDENSVKWLWGFIQNGICIDPNGNTLNCGQISNNAMQGLFGNLYQESHCCPFELQGWETQYQRCWDYVNDYSRHTRTAYAFTQETYGGGTKGFGLAQWTEESRKEGLWNYAPTLSGVVKNHSWLGDLERDANYLLYDLYTFDMRSSANRQLWDSQTRTVWEWLSDPNVSVYDAVNAVLMIYERPFETTPTYSEWNNEYNLRSGYAPRVNQDMTGVLPPTPPTPPSPIITGIPIYQMFYLMDKNKYTKTKTEKDGDI